ncbi:hypothetical protein DYB26_010935, partial [Aphanomyces astaci]
MANDLDWLGDEGMLAHALGIPTCTHNPLLCAITLTDPHWQRYCAAPTPARLAQLQATLHLSNEVDGDMLLTILAVIANELDRHPQPLVVVVPVEDEIDVPLNDVSNASLALPHNENIDDGATAARRPLIVNTRQKRTRMQMTSTAAGDGHELQLMRVKLQTVQARSIQRRWRDMVAQQKWELKLQTVQAESARMNQQLQARIIQSKWRVLRVQLQQQRNVHAVAVQQ